MLALFLSHTHAQPLNASFTQSKLKISCFSSFFFVSPNSKQKHRNSIQIVKHSTRRRRKKRRRKEYDSQSFQHEKDVSLYVLTHNCGEKVSFYFFFWRFVQYCVCYRIHCYPSTVLAVHANCWINSLAHFTSNTTHGHHILWWKRQRTTEKRKMLFPLYYTRKANSCRVFVWEREERETESQTCLHIPISCVYIFI